MDNLTDTELIATRLLGFVGCSAYSIDRSGTIKRVSDGFCLKHSRSQKGYLDVSLLSDTREKKTFRVHRLLAMAFLPNPLSKPFINHKDGNKANNALSNLEWCTALENNLHALKAGLRKMPETHNVGKHARLAYVEVEALRAHYGNRTPPIRALAQALGVPPSTLCRALKGKTYVKPLPGHKTGDAQRVAACVKVLREVQG